ncbi:MAG: EAL domain-containing protein [Pseudomonadota bacterium]
MNLRQRTSRYCATVLFLAGLAGVTLVYAVVASNFKPSFEIGLACALVVSLILHARAGFALSRAEQEIELLRRLVDKLEPERRKPNSAFELSNLDARAAEDADAEVLSRVKEAIEKDRIDLFLQPVIGLSDNSTPFFEAFACLRNRDGSILRPNDYIHAAERTNRIGVIDNMILFRSVQALRTLKKADPNRRIFCNTSPATLYDEDFFGRLTDYLNAHNDLAKQIIFEFTYPATEMMHPNVEKSLQMLSNKGYHFSVDHVNSLDLNWKRLQSKGFRFVKISAALLLNEARGGAAAQERARSFRDTLAKHDIELIVEKVENNTDLAEVNRIGLDYAQGELFGAPRPASHFIRAETQDARAA